MLELVESLTALNELLLEERYKLTHCGHKSLKKRTFDVVRVILASTLAANSSVAFAAKANHSDSFVNTIGVQTHIANSGNYTALYSTWVNRIQTAGIRHIRDGFWDKTTSDKAQNIIRTIKNNTGVNVKFLLTQGANCTDATGNSPTNYINWGWKPNQIDGFEGMDEIGPAQGWCGSNVSPTWYQQFDDDAQYLHNIVSDMPSSFKVLPIIPPSLAEYGRDNIADLNSDANLIGNITAFTNYGNWHVYCSAEAPSCSFSVFPVGLQPAFGTLPYWVTETGYTTPGDATADQAGRYYSRLFFEWFNHSGGTAKIFAYELLDDTSASGGEAGFGLLFSDASPKPAYTAISNEIAILNDPGVAFTPGSLNYTLSGGDFYLHHTLLQKRNGNYYLALWLEHNYWDTFSPESVTIYFFGATMSQVNTYNPLISASPISSVSYTTGITLSVSDATVILEIIP